MVFKSSIKESLYQELRAFILRYQSGLERNTIKPTDTTDMLTRQTFVHLRVTESNAVLVYLVDKEGNIISINAPMPSKGTVLESLINL